MNKIIIIINSKFSTIILNPRSFFIFPIILYNFLEKIKYFFLNKKKLNKLKFFLIDFMI